MIWITVSEAAELVGVSTTAIYDAIARKTIRKRVRYARVIVRRDDVQAYLVTLGTVVCLCCGVRYKSAARAPGACSDDCRRKLFNARQTRARRKKVGKL